MTGSPLAIVVFQYEIFYLMPILDLDAQWMLGATAPLAVPAPARLHGGVGGGDIINRIDPEQLKVTVVLTCCMEQELQCE